jgi:hypothetical protein
MRDRIEATGEGPELRSRTAGSPVGSSSTRPGLTGETGVDTLRLLFETDRYVDGIVELDGWKVASIPALGLTAIEGHPSPGALASSSEVVTAGARVRELVDDHLGVRRDRGVARLDVTTTRRTRTELHGRALIAGMAAVELPRCEATRRGTPVHSIAWTHAKGRRILGRCYDKGLERGGEPWRSVRLEDQGRFPSGRRPVLDEAASAEFQRRRLLARFEPMRKAVSGVKAASFPVVAKAIADEVRYGYRPAREAERLAGALVLLTGGASEGYARATMYRRRRELREAGFVVVDDFMEPVEVDLADELGAALEELA